MTLTEKELKKVGREKGGGFISPSPPFMVCKTYVSLSENLFDLRLGDGKYAGEQNKVTCRSFSPFLPPPPPKE